MKMGLRVAAWILLSPFLLAFSCMVAFLYGPFVLMAAVMLLVESVWNFLRYGHFGPNLGVVEE